MEVCLSVEAKYRIPACYISKYPLLLFLLVANKCVENRQSLVA